MLSPEDQAAVDAWLQRHHITRFPTGYSGVYDEFGRKRSSVKFVLAHLAKRIRARKGYASKTATELAELLEVPASDITAACLTHRIEIKT